MQFGATAHNPDMFHWPIQPGVPELALKEHWKDAAFGAFIDLTSFIHSTGMNECYIGAVHSHTGQGVERIGKKSPHFWETYQVGTSHTHKLNNVLLGRSRGEVTLDFDCVKGENM